MTSEEVEGRALVHLRETLSGLAQSRGLLT